MKSSVILLAALAISSLCLTSCGKESLTENISLDTSNQIKNKKITNRSSGTQFEFDEIVTLTVSDEFNGGNVLGSRQHASYEGERSRLVRGPSSVVISGIGDSDILNWGSWYVEVNLYFHRLKNNVSGKLEFTFPDMGDSVSFSVSGQPALVTNSEDNTQEFDMQLAVIEGTGRFEFKTFEGSAILLDVGDLFEQAKELSTYLVVDGVMLDTQ